MILLNPGPVVLSERVRQALLGPDLCHREVEFRDLQNSIRERLLAVYQLDRADWAAILLTGSGTSAMEAMLISMIPKQGKLLILENGVYGERMSKIAEIYAIDHVCSSLAWGEEIDLQRLDDQLRADAAISHVAVTHHETTTGRLNPLKSIASICQAVGVKLLVDGVSSFAAEALDFKAGISACAATANKCLHAVPGTSFVIVKRQDLAAADQVQRSLYLDLNSYLENQDQGGTPFTQSVQTFYALDEALAELADQGGWQARHQAYKKLALQVRQGLLDLGIKGLLSADQSSVVLNAYELPRGVSYTQLHDQLKERGFVIYAGQADLAKVLFRVSTMGAINAADMQRFLDAVAEIIQSR